eukprot:TRINITY_DN11572_c0_g1_i2.p1 TRINITY_DN11572_c0_g1~~TRINITY_DN11572_c0_g1_i2.p1  ORF type:complete len:207 (-),score=20.01 TRINITY_DN11572_c0_g1_i2:197-817(-)
MIKRLALGLALGMTGTGTAGYLYFDSKVREREIEGGFCYSRTIKDDIEHYFKGLFALYDAIKMSALDKTRYSIIKLNYISFDSEGNLNTRSDYFGLLVDDKLQESKKLNLGLSEIKLPSFKAIATPLYDPKNSLLHIGYGLFLEKNYVQILKSQNTGRRDINALRGEIKKEDKIMRFLLLPEEFERPCFVELLKPGTEKRSAPRKK